MRLLVLLPPTLETLSLMLLLLLLLVPLLPPRAWALVLL
jgi:hypothetical protein